MEIITLLNEKGGCGKTSTAVTLATLLSQSGYRVLLVDADSQGHATIATRLPREDRLYLLIKNNAPWKQVMQPAPVEFTDGDPARPMLWVVSSAEYTKQLNDDTIDPYLLKMRLMELHQAFDVVVIDTSPAIGHIHLMAILASTWLICPAEMLYYSIQGVYSSFGHLQNIQQEVNPDGTPKYRTARVMGILPTKYSKGKKVQKDNLKKLKAQFSEAAFFTPMKFLTAWDEASQLRRPINRLGYDHEAAPEAEKFVQEVMQRMGMGKYA